MKSLVISSGIHDNSDILKLYFKDIKNFKSVNEDELCKLIKGGDKEALDKLILANLLFVVSVAKQHKEYGLRLEDLINEGNLGLIRAAQLYDSSTGNKFISYAVWHIRAKILSYIQKNNTNVRIPSNKTNSVISFKKALCKMEQSMGCEINHNEALGLFEDEDKEIIDFYFTQYGRKDISIDVPYGDEGESYTLAESNLLSDTSFRQDLNYDNKDLKDMTEWALNQLSSLDRLILVSHLGYNTEQLNFREISELTDLTLSRVKIQIAYASRKMRMLIKTYEPSIESDLGLRKKFRYDSTHLIDRLPNGGHIDCTIEDKIELVKEELIEDNIIIEDVIEESLINNIDESDILLIKKTTKYPSIITAFKKLFKL